MNKQAEDRILEMLLRIHVTVCQCNSTFLLQLCHVVHTSCSL